jgi:phosphopantetheinyl transferase (holo-ACP synthase)
MTLRRKAKNTKDKKNMEILAKDFAAKESNSQKSLYRDFMEQIC